jgi:hypothetical protein
MRQDFGWTRSAQAYAELYRSLLVALTDGKIEEESVPAKSIA